MNTTSLKYLQSLLEKGQHDDLTSAGIFIRKTFRLTDTLYLPLKDPIVISRCVFIMRVRSPLDVMKPIVYIANRPIESILVFVESIAQYDT